jgi:hypothetical protein
LHDELTLMDQAVQAGVDGVDREAGAGRDPAGVRLIFSGPDQPQNGGGVLLNGTVNDRCAIKAQTAAELRHQAGGQRSPTAENLGKGGMVGDEIASEGAEGIKRVALAPPGKFRFKTLSE